jgi:putative transposase
MLAVNFVPVDCTGSPQCLSCFFVMQDSSRSVHILGVTANPTGPGPGSRSEIFSWIAAIAPHSSGSLSATGSTIHCIIRCGPGRCRHHSGDDPLRSPRANDYAQRFMLTVRTEVTDRMLIFSKRHLRAVLVQYTRHDNRRRPHRALHLQPPQPHHPIPHITTERIRR